MTILSELSYRVTVIDDSPAYDEHYVKCVGFGQRSCANAPLPDSPYCAICKCAANAFHASIQQRRCISCGDTTPARLCEPCRQSGHCAWCGADHAAWSCPTQRAILGLAPVVRRVMERQAA